MARKVRDPIYPDEIICEAVTLVNVEGWSKTQAAAKIGVTANTLYARAKKLGLELGRGQSFGRISTLQLPDAETDLAYIAGLFDGEGHISLVPVVYGRMALRVGITNTDVGVIQWLKGFGGQARDKDNDGRDRTCYVWQITARRESVELLTALLPYLRIKRGKAVLALQLMRDIEAGLDLKAQANQRLELSRREAEAGPDLHSDLKAVTGG